MTIKKAKKLQLGEVFSFHEDMRVKYKVVSYIGENGCWIQNIISGSYDNLRQDSTLKVFLI